MGDRLGTRVLAGSNARYCRIPLGYGCPTRAWFWDGDNRSQLDLFERTY
jgi:hypothetical protein